MPPRCAEQQIGTCGTSQVVAEPRQENDQGCRSDDECAPDQPAAPHQSPDEKAAADDDTAV